MGPPPQTGSRGRSAANLPPAARSIGEYSRSKAGGQSRHNNKTPRRADGSAPPDDAARAKQR
eukprot:scaffold2573_cov40-Tisochrysis_lutea.AAC.1